MTPADLGQVDQIWLTGDLTPPGDLGPYVGARDFSQVYPAPPAFGQAWDPGVQDLIGWWTSSDASAGGQVSYGPQSPQPIMPPPWPGQKVTPLSLTGLDPSTDAVLASRYRVVAAIAHFQCLDYMDGMNGYDADEVS